MIPEGWQVQNLADVALIILGQSPPSSACNEKVKGYPFYQGNADFGYRHPLPQRWIEKPLKIAQKDDILISVRAPVGELNIANTDCCIGRGVGSIRPLSANRNFIYYTLLNARNSLASVSQGSTFDAINGKELRSLSLLIPPLPEQMKIAAILSSVDDAIQATQAVIDQTRRVKSRACCNSSLLAASGILGSSRPRLGRFQKIGMSSLWKHSQNQLTMDLLEPLLNIM